MKFTLFILLIIKIFTHSSFFSALLDPQQIIITLNITNISIPLQLLGESYTGFTEPPTMKLDGKEIDFCKSYNFTSEGMHTVIYEFSTSLKTFDYMFEMTKFDTLEFKNVDASSINSTENMFANSNVQKINFSKMKFESCVSMRNFFLGCKKLSSIDISGFDTSKVKDFSGMFSGTGLEEIDLKNVDTSSAVTFAEMFSGNNKVKNIDISNFKWGGVESSEAMFQDCGVLEKIKFGRPETNNLKRISKMFYGCKSIQILNLFGFNTEQVTDFSFLFADCQSMTYVNISTIRTPKATNMQQMFDNCQNLRELNLTLFNTSLVENMERMFRNNFLLVTLEFQNFDTSKVKKMKDMFEDCKSLCDLDISFFDLSKVSTSSYGLFTNCENKIINLPPDYEDTLIKYNSCLKDRQCPNMTIPFWLDTECVDECPPEKPNKNCYTCIVGCPDKTPFMFNGYCLLECPPYSTFDENKTCTCNNDTIVQDKICYKEKKEEDDEPVIDENKGLGTFAIILIVVGGIIFLAIIGFILIKYVIKRKDNISENIENVDKLQPLE